MKLIERAGFDKDGNPTTIELPTGTVIKQALLNLDYSNGAIASMDAKDQLADRFCLSDEQKAAKLESGVNVWGQQVGIQIQALVIAKKLVRPKPATIITPEALKLVISTFLEKIGYGSTEIDVVENHDDKHFSAYVDIETQSLKFSVACDPTNTPTDA